MTDLDDLRYPIGHFSPPASSMAGIRAANIQTLRLLPERLCAAVAGLNDTQLDTPYREDGWTVRQVVHHVADSHAVAYIRFKLALTEDWPTIKTYDEAAWANLSDSRWLPIDSSLCAACGAACALGGAAGSAYRGGFSQGLHPPREGPAEPGSRAGDVRLALTPPHGAHHQPAHAHGLVENPWVLALRLRLRYG